MCLNPQNINVLNKETNTYTPVTVGCGKCSECLRLRTQNWRSRLMMESMTEGCQVLFLTLTYNDNCIPRVKGILSKKRYYSCIVPSISKDVYRLNHLCDFEETFHEYECVVPCKKDIQDFLKRLRIKIHRCGYDINFKYFVASEYGPRTLRPHYHALFFCYGSDKHKMTKKFISDSWKNGFIDVSLPQDNVKCANYVSGYVSICRANPYPFTNHSSNPRPTKDSDVYDYNFIPLSYSRGSVNDVRFDTFYMWSQKLGKSYFYEKHYQRVKNNIDLLINSNVKLQKLINLIHIGKQIEHIAVKEEFFVDKMLPLFKELNEKISKIYQIKLRKGTFPFQTPLTYFESDSLYRDLLAFVRKAEYRCKLDSLSEQELEYYEAFRQRRDYEYKVKIKSFDKKRARHDVET